MTNIVIVGGGIAGVSAALAVRKYDAEAQITILTADSHPFYNRIGLMGFVTNKFPEEQLLSYPFDFLDQKRISYCRGINVTALDTNNKKLTTSVGTINYDKLVLACGAAPFVPPAPGLREYSKTLWTLDNAKLIAHELASSRQKITIVGGGVLALESALELAAQGHHISIVEKENNLMATQLNSLAAAMLRNYVSAQGIDIYCGTVVAEVTANGKQVVLDSGVTISTDLLLVQAGVRPNVELAQKAEIKCNRGIIVDETMATNVPDIWACGNCVELNNNLELLWNPAREQAEIAAANLCGITAHYQPKPLPLHLKNSGFNLFVCGNWRDAAFISQEEEENSYRALLFNKEYRLVGAILVGDISSYPNLEQAIKDGFTTDPGTLNAMPPSAIQPPPTDEDGHEMTWDGRRWVCLQCGYSCEGPVPPAICPVCHVGRDQFVPA